MGCGLENNTKPADRSFPCTARRRLANAMGAEQPQASEYWTPAGGSSTGDGGGAASIASWAEGQGRPGLHPATAVAETADFEESGGGLPLHERLDQIGGHDPIFGAGEMELGDD